MRPPPHDYDASPVTAACLAMQGIESAIECLSRLPAAARDHDWLERLIAGLASLRATNRRAA